MASRGEVRWAGRGRQRELRSRSKVRPSQRAWGPRVRTKEGLQTLKAMSNHPPLGEEGMFSSRG